METKPIKNSPLVIIITILLIVEVVFLMFIVPQILMAITAGILCISGAIFGFEVIYNKTKNQAKRPSFDLKNAVYSPIQEGLS